MILTNAIPVQFAFSGICLKNEWKLRSARLGVRNGAVKLSAVYRKKCRSAGKDHKAGIWDQFPNSFLFEHFINRHVKSSA